MPYKAKRIGVSTIHPLTPEIHRPARQTVPPFNHYRDQVYIEKTEPSFENHQYLTIFKEDPTPQNFKVDKRVNDIILKSLLLDCRGGDLKSVASLMLWYYLIQNFTGEVSGFQSLTPPNHQLAPNDFHNYGQNPVNMQYGKGIGPRSITVLHQTSSKEKENAVVMTRQEAFQKLDSLYGGHEWPVEIAGRTFTCPAQNLASHLKHSKGLGYTPTSLTQEQLVELNRLGIVKYTQLGYDLPSLEDCKGMFSQIFDGFNKKPMASISELDFNHLEESIQNHQSNIFVDFNASRLEAREMKPGVLVIDTNEDRQITLSLNPEIKKLITIQRRSRVGTFRTYIKKYSSLNPLVQEKFVEYYKNLPIENQNFAIDPEYLLESRVLNLSKLNETTDNSNSPLTNGTITIILPSNSTKNNSSNSLNNLYNNQ